MLTCKQVSHALSEEDYEKLSPWRKRLLKLHVKWCIFCGKFNRQVMDHQDMCRYYREHEGSSPQDQAVMGQDQKDALKAVLAAHASDREAK
jgi:hypothetical protein